LNELSHETFNQFSILMTLNTARKTEGIDHSRRFLSFFALLLRSDATLEPSHERSIHLRRGLRRPSEIHMTESRFNECDAT